MAAPDGLAPGVSLCPALPGSGHLLTKGFNRVGDSPGLPSLTPSPVLLAFLFWARDPFIISQSQELEHFLLFPT